MKKILKLLLLVTIMLAVVKTNKVYAFDTGDMTYEEGAKRYAPTKEDIELERKKMQEVMISPLSEKFVTLPVTCYKQETNYYCGPATMQQVVFYVTNVKKEQSYFANKMGTTTAGTDFTVVANTLNSELGIAHYVYSQIGDINQWHAKIVYDLNNNYLTILDINTTGVASFPYNAEGHILNTSGFDNLSSVSKVRVTDPYEKGLGNRWYTNEDLYNANNSHFRKAMVW